MDSYIHIYDKIQIILPCLQAETTVDARLAKRYAYSPAVGYTQRYPPPLGQTIPGGQLVLSVQNPPPDDFTGWTDLEIAVSRPGESNEELLDIMMRN